MLAKCNEMVTWLEGNQMAEKSEFDDRLKEIQGVCNPLMTKFYQSASGGGAAFPGSAGQQFEQDGSGGAGSMGGGGPTIEEVD